MLSVPDAGLEPNRFGPFLLRERIGVGGMGEIFRARYVDGDAPGREVAVKRLLSEVATDPAFVGMFLDEARLAKRLDHPNVCRVHELGQVESHYYLAMDYIEGLTLKELLLRHGPLPWKAALAVAAGTAGALHHAHTVRGEDGHPLEVVHRDVSPANIMLRRDAHVVLVDFGLARARSQLHKTKPGLVKGKFGYLAPEQLGGEVDPRTDLFALGLCLYEALTGEPMFGQLTAADTVRAITDYVAAPVPSEKQPGIPKEVDAVLRRALARKPEDRFQTADELRRLLEGLAPDGPGTLRDVLREAMPDRAARPSELDALIATERIGRPTWPLLGAGAIAVLFIALALVLVFR